MNLLAFDTACDACSVALWRDGTVAARHARAMARGHAEALVPMIALTLREAGATFAGLTAVSVTIGPGGFTGLRIGLATARAIALAAHVPAIGVSTFDAIAASVVRLRGDERRNLVVAIETKRDDLYVQSFALTGSDARSDAGFAAFGEPAVLSAEAARSLLPPGPLLLAGDGAARLRAATDAGAAHEIFAAAALPDAADVASLAARRLAAGVPRAPLRPLYLRPPAARLPAASGQGPSSWQ